MTNLERKAKVEKFCSEIQNYFDGSDLSYFEYVPDEPHVKVVSAYVSVKKEFGAAGVRFFTIRSEILNDYDNTLNNALKNIKSWLNIR